MKFVSKFILSLSTIALILLAGCNRFDSVFHKPIPKTQPAKPVAQNDCQKKTLSSGSDLISRLDAALWQTPESKQWVMDKITCKRALPYQFNVVSINPAIIVGAPLQAPATQCSPIQQPMNCLASKAFNGSFLITDHFKHSPNLVWLSPEHGARLFNVPTNAKSIFLMINGKTIRLRRHGNDWSMLNQ